uniref:NAD(P)-binding domain-containing protein n=1 Tax=Hanusia phi TaxID=3032 RepID=A0A7S0E1B0_9CRYP
MLTSTISSRAPLLLSVLLSLSQCLEAFSPILPSALKGLPVPRASSRPRPSSTLVMLESGRLVGLVGATGGVGRLVAAGLLQEGYKLRAVVRSPERAAGLLPPEVEKVAADTRDPSFGAGLQSALEGVDAVIICTGTTAFPSSKWGKDGENSPKAVDDEGVKNVVAAIERVNEGSKNKIQRVTFLSSVGVLRRKQFPFNILNLYGVLDAKNEGEQAIMQAAERASFSYSIVRPGRLLGGPYTGTPDVASLLQLDEGSKQAVVLRNGDPDGFTGDASRKQAAMAMVQTLVQKQLGNVAFVLKNVEGPFPTQKEWDEAFRSLNDPELQASQGPSDFSFLLEDVLGKVSKFFSQK